MVDVDEQMRRRAEELYGDNARNSLADILIKEGCEVLDSVTAAPGWTELVDEELEYGIVPFVCDNQHAVDAALRHLALNRFANDGTFDSRTSQARIGDLMGPMSHPFEAQYLSDISKANDDLPLVQYQFDMPMAQAIDSFLKHRSLLMEKSLDSPFR